MASSSKQLRVTGAPLRSPIQKRSLNRRKECEGSDGIESSADSSGPARVDEIALGVIGKLSLLKVRIPLDLSIIGFDGIGLRCLYQSALDDHRVNPSKRWLASPSVTHGVDEALARIGIAGAVRKMTEPFLVRGSTAKPFEKKRVMWIRWADGEGEWWWLYYF